MTEPVNSMIGKARQALQDAHLLLDEGSAESSINRAYYAAFYVTSAALYLVGERPKTHAGVVDRFWVRFVQTGTFPVQIARSLRTALEARQQADYDFLGRFDAAAAADLLQDVERFIQATEVLIKDYGDAGPMAT